MKFLTIKGCANCPHSHLVKSNWYYCDKKVQEYHSDGYSSDDYPYWCPLQDLPKLLADKDGNIYNGDSTYEDGYNDILKQLGQNE